MNKINKIIPQEVPTWTFALTIFKRLTDEERLEVMSNCCKYCGRLYESKNDYCYCSHDE